MDAQNRFEYPTISTIDQETIQTYELSCDTNSNRKQRTPVRILIAALAVSVCLIMSSTRYNLPVALVSMVHDSCAPNTSICSDLFNNEHSSSNAEFQTKKTNNSFILFWELPSKDYAQRNAKECNANDNTNQHLLRWGEVSQGIALGVYYYGFIFTSIFGGRLAEKSLFGIKWLVALGLIGSALFNALIPIAARLSFGAFIVVRILTGACHGVILPSIFLLFQHWFPKREHTLALSFLLSGTALGLVINVPIVTLIKDFQILDGWPLLFYGGSFLHFIVFGFWWYFITDKPETHSLVKPKEVCYIRQNSRQILEEELNTAPWRAIIKSKTLYASIIAKFCWSFNHAIIIDNGPSYLNRVAGSDWVQASMYIALVYILTTFVYLLTSPFFNYIQSKELLNKTKLRIIFQSFVFLGASITMFVLPTVGCNETAILTLIATNMAFQGFIAGGEFPMLIDYSGNFAGTVYGIVSVSDSVARFLAPFIRGELVKTENSLHNWNILFTVCAILNLLGLIVFVFCADAKLQPWTMKKELTREISDEGEITDVKLDKTSQRVVLHEAQHNPNFRLPLNTDNDEWKTFKVFTLVP